MVPELDHRRRVEATGSGRRVVPLLVATTGHVELEEAALPLTGVVSGEQRHNTQALHGRRHVVAEHLAELVGLAVQAQRAALHLLVVLQLQLEEADHLHGRPGRTGDCNARVAVCGEHLLD